jgi:hypothetical protein
LDGEDWHCEKKVMRRKEKKNVETEPIMWVQENEKKRTEQGLGLFN